MKLPPVEPCRVDRCLAIVGAGDRVFAIFDRLIQAAVDSASMSQDAALEVIEGTNTIRCLGGHCVRLEAVANELRQSGYFDKFAPPPPKPKRPKKKDNS